MRTIIRIKFATVGKNSGIFMNAPANTIDNLLERNKENKKLKMKINSVKIPESIIQT